MKFKDWGFYIGILVLSALFLFAGNHIATRGTEARARRSTVYLTAVVTHVTGRFEGEHSTEIAFDARVTRGGRRGELLAAHQRISHFNVATEREVSAGDRVLIHYIEWDGFNEYHFFTYVRINSVMVLGAAFFVFVLLFGRKKGFNAIVGLGFTCISIFWVFIPAILAGRNVYATTIIICSFSIISTLLIVIGPNRKALSAIFGCLGGVALAGFLMLVMDMVMQLTGVSQAMLALPADTIINMPALIFAGVILGAVGAIMDVAMTISASLWELKETVGRGQEAVSTGILDFRSLFKSGLNIGTEILGTTLNSLILAYIGSSLSLILLISAQAAPSAELFNTEMIIVEFLRALVGSFGMLLTIPLTAVACGWLYSVNSE